MRRAIPFLLLSLIVALFVGGCDAGSRQTNRAPSIPLGSGPKIRFVRFKTSDGLLLSGRIYGNGGTAVVLGHMYGTDQTSWLETARVLTSRGFKVLTFDFRGYGLSGGVKEIPKIDRDMNAALDFMKRRDKQVFLIGAGMGGTAALRVAAKTRVAGVATISAPAEFLGLSPGRLAKIKGPKLFIVAARDDGAPEAARRFYSEAAEPKELQIVPGAEQGTNMMQSSDSEALKQLVGWVQRNK